MPTLKTITENMYSTSDSSLETGLNKSCLLSGSVKRLTYHSLPLPLFSHQYSYFILFHLLHTLLCIVGSQGSVQLGGNT